MRPYCVTCGRPFAVAKVAKPVDTAQLSVKALYAHFRASAPLEDVRFFLATAVLSSATRAAVKALLATGCTNRAETYRQLGALQDRWRAEDYWHRIVVPRKRLARRRARAQRRTHAQQERAA